MSPSAYWQIGETHEPQHADTDAGANAVPKLLGLSRG